MVKSGNLVTANSTELMTIAQVEPVFVTFSVPALHLPAIKRNMKDHELQVMATTQDAEGETGVGALSFIDNNVDASTDTVKLKASFVNAERALWPGQFVRVTLRLATLSGATVVPSQAVQTGQDGQFVFVVTPEATVEQRTVTTGERLEQDVVIQSGLQPGETVVTEGQLRLEPGSRVQLGDGARRAGATAHAGGRRTRSGPRARRAGPMSRGRPSALTVMRAAPELTRSSVMNLSERFIRRPIATSLLMAAIALFGVVAYRALPVSDLPQVDYPTLNVSAGLPGGDPGTMASAVASPLERQFTTIAGLDSMTSSSGTGNTNITLQFDLDRDIDSAAVDVQTAIAEVMPLLPAGMPAPPSFRKNNPADQPILILNLTSRTLPMSVLDDYAETIIAPRISMINGVSQVQVQGAAKYAVRVQMDPDKLRAQHIGINEIDQALQNWNVNMPTGQLFGPTSTFNIKAAGQLMNAGAVSADGRVLPQRRAGAPGPGRQRHRQRRERLQRRLVLHQGPRQADSQRAITMQVMRQPGSNTIAVTDAVRALLPAFAGAAAAVGAHHVRARIARAPSATPSTTSRSRCW